MLLATMADMTPLQVWVTVGWVTLCVLWGICTVTAMRLQEPRKRKRRQKTDALIDAIRTPGQFYDPWSHRFILRDGTVVDFPPSVKLGTVREGLCNVGHPIWDDPFRD